MIAARYAKTLAAILSAGALFFASAADACTGIRLTAADGTVVHARTLNATIGTPQHQPRCSLVRLGTHPRLGPRTRQCCSVVLP